MSFSDLINQMCLFKIIWIDSFFPVCAKSDDKTQNKSH